MDLEKIYYDLNGKECNILQLVKKEPEWAANRIQVGEAAIRTLNDIAASQQDVEAKCGCKHEDRFDCEYMDENKNCAINKKG